VEGFVVRVYSGTENLIGVLDFQGFSGHDRCSNLEQKYPDATARRYHRRQKAKQSQNPVNLLYQYLELKSKRIWCNVHNRLKAVLCIVFVIFVTFSWISIPRYTAVEYQNNTVLRYWLYFRLPAQNAFGGH
jgi:hypothetical protein